MPRTSRYVLYSLIFALALIGLIIKTQTILTTCLILAILIGVIADGFDNARDERFKKYNVKHKHHKLGGQA
ncbi:hypothetical protein [Sulfoacidibacillus thermotolerans]|uniref:Uncharacterized protein n=1 Tax=Sulfoacidibacillus thermotolerans TaxID=1765684 RepID=A0A2U3D8W9_SULT2|nr:hypothetical protein [Sulfoacidibacillus thermotolerans]PWI57734.1 hypothetical protein BM613_07035 [Sulfoacidibacillus thermotolerans]